MPTRAYPPDFCDAAEMAYLISMARSTFLEHVAARRLPEGILIGGRRLWSRARVIDALEALYDPERNAPFGIRERARGELTAKRRQSKGARDE
ncbi:hypothetical protein [Ancylobacter sp. TS-1]|uniref:hypothetical protein n=1 Tax=Ancylobacter sp. TS-1 TaxID=1850374 RepID=UPI001265B9AB|nr:hypothetical protein [Ancylobacter sp. TS-1]QFR34717.1 hypothetical protein GBB76_17300 [Ancylobacter sp. TS-1]